MLVVGRLIQDSKVFNKVSLHKISQCGETINVGLIEARSLGLNNIIVEEDSMCAIMWAWRLVDVTKEVMDLAACSMPPSSIQVGML